MSEIASSAGASSITFADVVEALGDTDISTTNASKLRATLGGRGSFSTIQKHLDTIRAQRIKAQQPEAVQVPAAPPELLQMWGAAVQIATAQVRIRLDAVVQTRDMLTGGAGGQPRRRGITYRRAGGFDLSAGGLGTGM